MKKPVQSVYQTRVVATKVIANTREGTFTHQLAMLARKPVVLANLITMVAAHPDGARKKRTPTQRQQVARVRVRQALTRFKYLKRAA